MFVAVIPVADNALAVVLYDKVVTVLSAKPLPDELLVEVKNRVVAPADAATETEAAAAVGVAHCSPNGNDVSTVKTWSLLAE